MGSCKKYIHIYNTRSLRRCEKNKWPACLPTFPEGGGGIGGFPRAGSGGIFQIVILGRIPGQIRRSDIAESIYVVGRFDKPGNFNERILSVLQ